MDLQSACSNGTVYDLAKQGKVFVAFTSITGITAFGTAAATGGPLLWNNTGPNPSGAAAPAGTLNRVQAVILGVSAGWTTAPGASGVLGLTWNSGQTSAPTSTTAITGAASTLVGAPAPLCNVYNAGTVANAGTTLLATHEVSTSTSQPSAPLFVPIEGGLIVQPGCWASVAAAATISTMVGKISLYWAEIPY